MKKITCPHCDEDLITKEDIGDKIEVGIRGVDLVRFTELVHRVNWLNKEKVKAVGKLEIIVEKIGGLSEQM